MQGGAQLIGLGLKAWCVCALAAMSIIAAGRWVDASPISEDPDLNTWGTDGTVFALARLGDIVYLGGRFTNIVSTTGTKIPARSLAAFDVRTGEPTSWRPNANDTVFAITPAADGSTIYVGGSFNRIDGVTRTGFAAIGLNGNLLWSADCVGAVKAITLSGNKIYLGGIFSSVNGQTRNCVAVIQPPTSGNKASVLPWSGSITGGDQEVAGLALANGDLVAMGKFEYANGQLEPYQARFDAVTGASKGWENNIATAVKGLVTDGMNYYAAQGGGGGKVVCWGPTGKFKWRKSGDGDVQAIAYCAGQIIAGGHWNFWEGTTLGRLVALNPLNGAVDQNWFPNPDLGGAKGVWAICDGGDRLHVGGGFKKVGAIRYNRYAQFAIPDGQPPTTPTNVIAIATSPVQVNLAWKASTDNKRLLGYEVWRNDNLLARLGTVTNYNDRAVAPGASYAYRVRASDASGLYSGYSSPITVTTPTDTENPTAPTNLTATATGPARIDLAWGASADNVAVKGYQVFRDGAPIASVGVVTNYTDNSAIPSTHYAYLVRARDVADNVSEPSNPADATTPADSQPPAAPLGVNAKALSATQIRVGWSRAIDDVGIAGYDLYRDGALLVTVGAVTNYTDSGLLPLTTYGYHLIARDLAGNQSAPSATATASTLADKVAPSKPNLIKATAFNSRQVDLVWSASTDNVAVMGYRIYRNSSLVGTVGVLTNYSDTTAAPSTTYKYKLRAFDAANNQSSYSSEKSVSTPSRDRTPPSGPTNLVATAISPTQIDLQWKAATDNRKVIAYDILRDGSLLVSIGAVTNYSDTAVAPLTTYSYQVRARDADGNMSNPSTPANATTLADTTTPTAPSGLTATAASAAQVDLAWTGSTDNVGVTRYDIYRDGGLLGSVGVDTSYSDATVSPFTIYSYQVLAGDAAGNVSDPSNTATVTTPDTLAPTAPSDLTATAIGPTRVDLGWSASTDDAGVTAYDVYRDGDLLASIGSATNYSDTSAMPLTAYEYQVRARDGAGNVSSASNTASATTPADTTTPTAPTNFTANAAGPTQVDLQWDASTDNIAVTDYDIYRGGSFLANVGGVTNYSDTTVSPGASYDYEVRAHDAAGNISDPSNMASATTPNDSVPPSAPTDLTATAASATKVNLAWSSATDNVGISGYDVYRDGSLLVSPVATTNYSDTTVSPLTTCSYEVRARDAAGNLSDASNSASATTPADTTPPTAPTGLTALAMSGTQIDLAWSAPIDDVAVTGYEIYREGSLLASIGTTASYSDMTASPATTYQYQVVALDNAGNFSDPSNTASATTPDTVAPGAPSDLTASAPTATQVELAWIAATDNVAVTGYEIFRDGSLLATVGGALTNYSDATVGPLTAYDYQVRARDAADNLSDASNTSNVTTPPDSTPPTAPTNLNAVATSWIQIDLTWEESTDDVGVTEYDIYRDGLSFATATQTNYSDIPVFPFTTYEYQVFAKDAAGNLSDSSNTASVTTTGDTEQPSAPTDLTAAASSATQVDLAWIESTDNVGVAGYNVYRGSQIAALGAATNYTDTTAAPDTTYNYEVKARDDAGNLSDPSNTETVTTPPDIDPPTAPSNLSASPASPTQVDLIWNASTDNVAITGYEVYRDALLIDTIGVQTTYSDATVASSTTYNYEVRARDAAANVSGPSNAASVITP